MCKNKIKIINTVNCIKFGLFLKLEKFEKNMLNIVYEKFYVLN